MKQQELISRLCKLTAEVTGEVFHLRKAADCFCNENFAVAHPNWNWQHDEAVIEFVEQAVRGAIAMHKLTEERDYEVND
ncbi:MAG: hypothetical protein ACYTEW_20845 [Planctomycetota bacterium]|jgi:hypothetical protein